MAYNRTPNNEAPEFIEKVVYPLHFEAEPEETEAARKRVAEIRKRLLSRK